MLAKTIDTGPSALLPYEASSRKLLLEWGPRHLHAVLWNLQTGSPEATESFSGALADEDAWETALGQSRLLQLRQVPVTLLCAGARLLPVPMEHYQPAASHLHLQQLHGYAAWQAQRADMLPDVHLALAWQMPDTMMRLLTGHFEQLTQRHLLGALLAHPLHEPDTTGHLVFTPQHLLCLLHHQGRLQYAGALPVLQPDDLAYRLLQLLQAYHISPEATSWRMAGVLQTDSALWQGLARFLEGLEPWPVADTAWAGQQPAHYFAHLFQLMS
jgi:hypothetical protein